jgi:RNA-directed DNA polymerase
VNWVLDGDIRSFFDSVYYVWLLRMVAHRIADPRILQLIGLWMRAGVLESGEKQETDRRRTPQGAGISPLLQHLPALHPRSLDPEMASWLRTRSYRDRALRGRLCATNAPTQGGAELCERWR